MEKRRGGGTKRGSTVTPTVTQTTHTSQRSLNQFKPQEDSNTDFIFSSLFWVRIQLTGSDPEHHLQDFSPEPELKSSLSFENRKTGDNEELLQR